MTDYRDRLVNLLKKKIDVAVAFRMDMESSVSELIEEYSAVDDDILARDTLSALNEASIYIARRRDISESFKNEMLSCLGSASKMFISGL